MSNGIEQAREALEEAEHQIEEMREEVHKEMHNHGARNAAVLIAALAASLALSEMGEKASQNQYLTHHITLTDTWAFYQVRNVRATILSSAADTIASLPNVAPEAAGRVAQLRKDAALQLDDPEYGEGRKQLAERAKHETELRDHSFHMYHQFELATSALQIAIVLASASIATRMKPLTMIAAVIGGVAALYALGVATDII